MEIKSNSVEELFKDVSTGEKHEFTNEESIEFINITQLTNQKTIDEYSTYRVGLIFNLADETSFLTGYLPKSFWYGKYYCIFEIINVKHKN
mgnify:CR=1 FL=1